METSGDYCSVALWRDGAIEEREMLAGQRQSGLLIDMVHALLNECRVSLRQMDGIAYGAGPGSFTGLRVACGVVQGLAMGANKPVVGVGTLMALAQSQPRHAIRVVCCIDARMKEVYHAAYEKNTNGWRAVHEPGVYAPNDVPSLPGANWQACGNGFAVYADLLRERYASQLAGVDASAHPGAREVAAISAPVFATGGGMSAECAAPIYVRDKVALKTHER
ncbi:MAG: tRNA (adenosine(37)-N6)-threonylcarbamoyltransferase complex dimerization subunit type 1 TsaB [Burkholderiales bacterium]